MIQLTSGDLELDLDAAKGGTVLALRFKAQNLLRPAIAGSTDPRDRAAFPLVPFAGRIARGRFNVAGRAIQLRKNLPPEPHAIHGHGWQSMWQITEQSALSARLELHHSADDWPWSYRATQHFELHNNALSLKLTLTNRADEPMPAGLGWHPYFPKQGACLSVPMQAFWPNNDELVSLNPTQPEWLSALAEDIRVEQLSLDNAFTAASQVSAIRWPSSGLQLQMQASSSLGYLTLYTPKGEPFFCVEPISHAPNCLNSDLDSAVTGKKYLEPGATLEAKIVLSASLTG